MLNVWYRCRVYHWQWWQVFNVWYILSQVYHWQWWQVLCVISLCVRYITDSDDRYITNSDGRCYVWYLSVRYITDSDDRYITNSDDRCYVWYLSVSGISPIVMTGISPTVMAGVMRDISLCQVYHWQWWGGDRSGGGRQRLSVNARCATFISKSC